MATNKIGVQVIGDRFDPARLVGAHGEKPRVVKLVDCSLAYYQRVRAVVGSKVLIDIRWVQSWQPLDNPLQRAREWFEAHRTYIEAAKSDYTVFEGYNEIADSDAIAYVVFEIERVRLVHSISAWACIGNWSVGVPEIALWTLVYRPLVIACVGQDVIGLHEYCIDTADIDNRWHCGRWTLVPMLAGKRKLITEFGRDIVEGKGQAGWMKSCSKETIVSDIRKYCGLVDQYSEVIGVAVFQTGSYDAQWAPFEVSSFWEQITGGYEMETNTTPSVVLKIDGRCMGEQEFKHHVNSLTFGSAFKPERVFIHHTWKPTLESWNGAATIEAMRLVYQDDPAYGWTAGPHLFVAPDGIWLFTSLNKEGIGVADHNKNSWHLEMVGNYDLSVPSGAVLEYTMFALMVLMRKAKLDLGDIYFHREYSTKTCPGSAISKAWFLDKVRRVLELNDGMPTDETVNDAHTLVNKARWWMEEWTRWSEAGYTLRARELQLGLIELMYRAENAA